MPTARYSIALLAILSISNALEVSEDQVTFYLRNQIYADEILLTSENLGEVDPTKPTKFIIHGKSSSHLDMEVVSNALLKTSDVNVILVDYKELAASSFEEVPYFAQPVGEFVAKFIQSLMKQTVKLADVHIIGHSLGCHVARYAGQSVIESTASKVGRITEMDPANIDFSGVTVGDLPMKDTALLVDVIHTDSSGIYVGPVGQIDFFPNGGQSPQPGCEGSEEENLCSHMRSMDLFAEEVENRNGFLATKCDSWENFREGLCEGNSQVNMGGDLQDVEEGSYYLYTNAAYPYSLN